MFQAFTVPKWNCSVPHLVVDLSHLNSFIKPFQFWMLTVSQVNLALHLCSWFMALDLENA